MLQIFIAWTLYTSNRIRLYHSIGNYSLNLEKEQKLAKVTA